MKKLLQILPLVLIIVICFLSTQSGVVQAQDNTEFKLLQPIPQLTSRPNELNYTSTTASSYINGLIKLTVAAAGVLAVIKIIYGGIVYMSTDAFSGKSSARKHITDAIWGLLLVISSFVILNTINPNLVNLKIEIDGQENAPLIGPGTFTPSDPYDASTCTDNCVAVDAYNFNKKTPAGGGCSLPGPCLIYKGLAEKLVVLNRALGEQNLDWQVTEMYPPKYRAHESACHNPGPQAGKCVDASLSSANRSPAQVRDFLQSIRMAGFSSFQYEMGTKTAADRQRYNQLVNSGLLRAFRVVQNDNATGEHVHINY